MKKDLDTLIYPQINIGTEQTKITLYSSIAELTNQLLSEEDTCKKFFITDANVASLSFMSDFISLFVDGEYKNNKLLILGSGEPYKTFESIEQIIVTAIDSDFSRNDIFVGIGGGVICDLTAFASSIYKRGAKLQLVPTTLLAMVDASIGGKTGCDFKNYKNMIGTFYPASSLSICSEFIQTLPENQYNSGLAEVFKTALINDKELFDFIENEHQKIIDKDKDALVYIIEHCIKVKSNIVKNDLTEKNIRAFLNLGHTFGHALETILGLGTITHGQAVAWGISRIVTLSCNKGLCNSDFCNKVLNILQLYNWETKSIPSLIKGGNIGHRFLEIMHKDKKNTTDKISLVLIKDVGNIIKQEVSDDEILLVLK